MDSNIMELLTVSSSSGAILIIIGRIYLTQINKSFDKLDYALTELKKVVDLGATKVEVERFYHRLDEQDAVIETLSQRLSRLQGAHDVWHSKEK